MYLPFGGTRWESGATPTDFQFTGQRKEAGFGLYDYNARYYDPLLGRFVSADAVVPGAGNPQALNRYAYVFNNPLKYTDPSGHCGESVIGFDPGCDGGLPPLPTIPQAQPAPRPATPNPLANAPTTTGTPVPPTSNTPTGTPTPPRTSQGPVVYDPACRCGVPYVYDSTPEKRPNRTLSISLAWNLAIGAGVQGSFDLIHLDSQGNVVLGALSIGPMGTTGVSISAGPQIQVTNGTVPDLAGWTVNGGGWASGAVVGGSVDYVAGKDRSYEGISVFGGVGPQISFTPPFLAGIEAGASHTWFSPIQFNIFDLLK
jgi:RHS repeat-associated protein